MTEVVNFKRILLAGWWVGRLAAKQHAEDLLCLWWVIVVMKAARELQSRQLFFCASGVLSPLAEISPGFDAGTLER